MVVCTMGTKSKLFVSSLTRGSLAAMMYSVARNKCLNDVEAPICTKCAKYHFF